MTYYTSIGLDVHASGCGDGRGNDAWTSRRSRAGVGPSRDVAAAEWFVRPAFESAIGARGDVRPQMAC